MNFSQRNAFLNHFFFLSYLVILLVTASNLKHTFLFEDTPATVYVVAVFLSYGFIYLLPALLITKLAHRLLAFLKRAPDLSPATAGLLYTLAIALTAATNILLFADARIFEIFGFHFNGFIWNLLTTPGGIESMGADNATTYGFALAVLGFIVLQTVLCLGLFFLSNRKLFAWVRRPIKLYRYLLLIFLLCTISERLAYGYSSMKSYAPVLISAQAFPAYLPCTYRHLARKLGVKGNLDKQIKVDISEAALSYPLSDLKIVPPEKPMNIVWLVAESWRWDMLDPEITPEAWKFARQSFNFLNHYSGGNGTRMGMFTMFYGLHGPYWFDFLNARRSPILMDVLQQQNYQLALYTSAKFSYPEFDKTLFASVPRNSLHDNNTGQGWQRDRKNVTELIRFIKNRDPNRPFMTFMFFESPHARYYFPQESILRRNYLQDFNYATMNLEEDIELIKNRYINSCHHLDSQLARIFDFLKERNLMQNTIVILTGDHGEEFMEKGRWGHGSTFAEEQIKTPLVLWVPGIGSNRVKRMTSHLDIVPTLLPLMGVKNPPEDYSFGYNLLNDFRRTGTVVSDWSHICYVDSSHKLSIPLKASGGFNNELKTRDDVPVADKEPFMENHQKMLVKLMRQMRRFKQK